MTWSYLFLQIDFMTHSHLSFSFLHDYILNVRSIFIQIMYIRYAHTLNMLKTVMNALHRLPGTLNQSVHRRLSRSLKCSFQEDRKQRAATAGALVEAELSEGHTREAWKII